ncbi:S41 family peptidase [Neolewinella agarilytica]|uniref:C-terminal processing peptidase-3. Serine peptidase. MEROPS family S41A n=1 Tax=Neolewinella agarilytica TaxID=478744 RepID=A0A1H9EZW2_9BACT|nr:S41 family peptidase [Neolewinella agarilytica]SEQ31246.1 C-terminal processing peptidase-3. Serine peptidase. MEROPS family S41A [Neolewinella agarilytica]
MSSRKKAAAGIVTALVFVLCTAATVSPVNDKFFEIMKAIEVYTNVYKEVNTYYVDEIEPNKLMRTGIEAMVSSLDPYTNYISETDVELARLRQSGKYQGVGAKIEYIDGLPTILTLYKDQPADAAGLKTGDRLLTVDGRETEGYNREQLEEIMRGFPGTTMQLTVDRPGVGKKDISLIRGDVNIPNVPYSGMLADNVGYVALTTFTQAAGKNVRDAVAKLRAENPELKGVVLDLRNNGGGLLNEAVDIVNIFVPKDELIVTTKGKVRDWDRSYSTKNNPLDLELPVAVLINGRSASASEIVSGSLQDLDRAVLIGQRSYGKGLVQNIMETGYGSRVKITTAKYYIPSLRCIQALEYKDGKPVNIPDDQRAVFKTRAGRKVLDGGGVAPDIDLPVLGGKAVTQGLLEEFVIFDFVNDWVTSHPSIDSVADFRFQDWDQFVGFLQRGDFEYTSKAEKALEEALLAAKEEGYEVADQLQAIQKRVDEEQMAAIQSYKDEIISIIEKEIAGRYYYQRGEVQMGLRNDREVQEAISVLNDPARYAKLLKP